MKRKIRSILCKTPKSLNRRLLLFILLCWIVPVAVFFLFTTVSYREGIIGKVENLMEQELENAAAVISIRINEAVNLSQRPSYEKTWENSWIKYRRGELNKRDYLVTVNASLKGKFYLDERFNTYAFYMYGSDRPDCYGSRVGTQYNRYLMEVQDEIQKVMDSDSSYTYVRVFENKMYIIRNLYSTSRYERFGTLVVELNVKKVFQGVPGFLRSNMLVLVENQKGIISFFEDVMPKNEQLLVGALVSEYDGKANGVLLRRQRGGYNGYLYEKKFDDYHVGILVTRKWSEMYESLYTLYRIAGLMLLLFVPLVIYAVLFLKKQIRTPIRRLTAASKQIEAGQIGACVEGGDMPNGEFQYLMDSFNSMSKQVKYLFDTVYSEKLARKDAQIQALTAQINPHFLNNTLEMMNWQARMSGDAVISKMIEALGVVLDHRMNRANVKEIHLSEELYCTESYLYIMSMRFGQRLSIEREIDEELLYMDVPPLILQPLVENAIVHGVECVKNGSMKLHIFHDDTYVYLRVINTGKPLEEEELARIARLLAGDGDAVPKQKGRHTSIGIRNVNQRVKLVYGEEYGLSITRGKDDQTVSTVTLPYIAKINK